MEKLNLEKVLEKGSLRWLGKNYEGLLPADTVIAGRNMKVIADAVKLPCYKVGRLSVKNIFMMHDSEKIFYVFVNPGYKYYRKAFGKIIGGPQQNFHVDHTLARNLALYYGYNYVLLCKVPAKVNMRHGHFEKIKQTAARNIPEVCYADTRIFDKILSRNPLARRTKEELNAGYAVDAVPSFGLTLKQQGIWNEALCFSLIDLKNFSLKTTLINLDN